MNHKELKEQIISAAYKSVTELIKVLGDEIISDDEGDISADKMRNAVLAKKQALDDAFYILNKIEIEKENLEEGEETNNKTKDEPKFKTFAESRGRK